MPAAEQVSGDNCFIDVQMWDGGIRRSDVLFLYPHPHPLPQSGKKEYIHQHITFIMVHKHDRGA